MRRFALAAGLLSLSIASAPGAFADAALVSATGSVEVGRGTPLVWRAAKLGEALRSGDAIRTGANSRAELKLGDERVARVYADSLLRIGAATDAGVKSVELDAGASIFDLVKRALGGEFDVRTPEITVSVKGTRFLVEAGPGADQASVFRGEVALAGEGFGAIAVHPGFTGMQGDVFTTPFGDPWDAWATGAGAPELIADALRTVELKEAVEAAREDSKSEGAPPAKLEDVDPEKKSERGRDGVEGLGESIDDVRSDSRDGGGASVEVDGVADVASHEAKEGDGTSSMLLDAVLAGDSDDFPGGGSAAGNGQGSGTGGGNDEYMNGQNGTTTPFPFTFDVQTSGGPNTVTVGFGSAAATLDQNGIDDLLRGNRSPLGSFNAVLNQLNVDPVALATYLDTLL
jgi:hypothetical protein